MKNTTKRGCKLGIAIRIEDRVDCRVDVTQQHGDDDRWDVGTTGKQRDGIHDVYRHPAQRKHGQDHTEPLGCSDFGLPRQFRRCVVGYRLLLLLLWLIICL